MNSTTTHFILGTSPELNAAEKAFKLALAANTPSVNKLLNPLLERVQQTKRGLFRQQMNMNLVRFFEYDGGYYHNYNQDFTNMSAQQRLWILNAFCRKAKAVFTSLEDFTIAKIAKCDESYVGIDGQVHKRKFAQYIIWYYSYTKSARNWVYCNIPLDQTLPEYVNKGWMKFECG